MSAMRLEEKRSTAYWRIRASAGVEAGGVEAEVET